jgi:signal transduction histidine kinase
MKRARSPERLTPRYLVPVLITFLLFWLAFLGCLIRQQSVADLAGPNENPYWGIAQFRIAADDFKTSLLKYQYGARQDPYQIRFKYEILISKFFVIAQHSESTRTAYRQPQYAATIQDLDHAIAAMDTLMARFPAGGDALTASLVDASAFFDTAYDRLASAVGLSEVRRRDALLGEALRNRNILLYSNIGVSVLFFIAILIFSRSTQNFGRALHTAQQVAHTKQVFLAAINHELRNPLQTIVSATENISHYATSRELMLAVLNIDHAVKHIETHMRDLTDYLRLNTHKINLHTALIDLRPLANDAVRRFRPLADKKAIRLRATLYTSQTRFVSDEQRVQQIIDNLVENAIKYSSSGTVEIRCGVLAESGRARARIEVIDEGIGIDRNKIGFLFSPFFQSQFQDSPTVSGYGMGLAVVRGLIEVLGGEIAVASDVGRGTTFTVTLPCQGLTAPEALPAQAPPDAAAPD